MFRQNKNQSKTNQAKQDCATTTPSPHVASILKNNCQDIDIVETKQQTEKIMAASTAPKEKTKQKLQFLEHEIECPRCHDNMELCFEFDDLYYFCKECDFCLYTIKRN